jgi:hypothetical protein
MSSSENFFRALAEVLAAHQVPQACIETELIRMDHIAYAKTANRIVLGIMNEFIFLAGVYRDNSATQDLLALSIRLAETPCRPLYKGPVTPKQALQDLIGSQARSRPAL